MHVLGVVGGSKHTDLRVRSAQETAKRNVDGTESDLLKALHGFVSRFLFLGFLLAGFGLGESFAERESLLAATIVYDSALCHCSRLFTQPLFLQKELPSDKPRMIAGISSPLEVLQCIEQGIDLINNAYPTIATELGQALNFAPLLSASFQEGIYPTSHMILSCLHI